MLKHHPHSVKVNSAQLQEMIKGELQKQNCPKNKIDKLIGDIHKFYGKINGKEGKDNLLLFVSPREIEAAIKDYASNNWCVKKSLEDAIMKTVFEDDLALFGRMVAGDKDNTKIHKLGIEGATSFNQPCTVHKIEVESDFYTVNIDVPVKPGAFNMGHRDFASGTFYKYFAINLDTLLKNKNGNLKEVKEILTWNYLKNFCIAVPSAHNHDMVASTRPGYICMVIREDQPHLIDFEKPIRIHGDETYTEVAAKWIEAEIEKWKELGTVYCSDMSKFDDLLKTVIGE